MTRPWTLAAALLAASGITEALLLDPRAGWVAGVVAAVVLPLPLFWLPRRQLRGAAAVVVVALGAALSGAHPDEGLTPIAVGLLAALGMGRWLPAAPGRSRSAAAAAGLGVAAVVALALLYREPDPSLRALPFFLAFVGASFALGRQLRARALERDDLESRRERLERERAAQVAAAVAAERERIAAELHAIIASGVDKVAAGAARAEAELDTDPHRAVATLREVRGAASGALTETRRLLGLLRAEAADYAPQPGLRTLADRGYAVHVAPAALERDLPPGLELAVVRIIEEAVTAVAPEARDAVRVDVACEDGELSFSVGVDAARLPWPERDPALAGMRERVRIYGGQLRPVAEAEGWTLRGSLPLRGSAA